MLSVLAVSVLVLSELVDPGVLVLADGSIAEDTVEIDRAGRRVAIGTRRSRCTLDDVVLLRAADGRLVHHADDERLAQGLWQLIEHDLAAEYADLAFGALKSLDPDLMERLVTAARDRGWEGDLARVEKSIVNRRKSSRKPRAEVVQEIEAQAAQLDASPRQEYWRLARSVQSKIGATTWLALLDSLLERDPTHAQATAEVRRLIVDGMFAGTESSRASLERLLAPEETPFDARAWIDCLRLAEHFPIEMVTPPDGDRVGISLVERKLGQLTFAWRPDLVCLQTENLRVMTPLRAPGAIARCLRMGELVSRTLSERFAAGRPPRDEARPLTLHLYEDREEYRQKSASQSQELGGTEWSAGHYDPGQNVQHTYLPARADAFERVMRVYAHELAHNWMEMKCPLFTLEDVVKARNRPRPQGYWIVEGLAEFVEEFDYDLERGLADPLAEQVNSLDVVANAAPGQLIPWSTLYGLGHEGMHALSPQAQERVPISWEENTVRVMSQIGLFYMQSAATVHYLYSAGDGRQRELLLEYATSYYTARAAGLDVEHAFGCTAGELGARVVAYARERARR